MKPAFPLIIGFGSHVLSQMVESGWYFCPNDDSDDLASCAYCKLSLDGWEPKDDP